MENNPATTQTGKLNNIQLLKLVSKVSCFEVGIIATVG